MHLVRTQAFVLRFVHKISIKVKSNRLIGPLSSEGILSALTRLYKIAQFDAYPNDHRHFHHVYHKTVVNEVRQIYFIPKLRVVLKKIGRSCQRCKNQRAKPAAPEMSDLPLARLASLTHALFRLLGLIISVQWLFQSDEEQRKDGGVY